MYLQDVSRYFKEYHGITVAHFQKDGINSIWYMSKKNPLHYHSPFLLVLSNYTSLSSMSYTWIVVEDDVEEVLVSPCDVVLVFLIEWVKQIFP